MEHNKSYINRYSILVLVFALFFASGIQANTTSIGDQTIRLNDEVKFKRVSNGTVSLSFTDNFGKFHEYVFTDITADVINLVYRNADLEMIVSNISRKYFMSKTDARRNVKQTINTLEQWHLIKRDYPSTSGQ